MKKFFFYILLVVIFFFILKQAGILTIEEDKPTLIDSEELADTSDRITDFSFDVFSQMLNEEENLFISPYSIHSALAMTCLGSDGETKEEMETVLNIEDDSEIKQNLLDLKQYLEYVSESSEVKMNNGLFLRKDFIFKAPFQEKAKTYFQAKVDSLPQNGEVINDWVAEKTEGKITELIDPGPIDSLTVAYLINTIYFKGDWEKEFKEENTIRRDFFGMETKEIDMMENEGSYDLINREDLKVVKLDYADKDYSFYAIMPDDLKSFSNNFDREKFEELESQLNNEEISLRLPKFTFNQKLNLNKTLKALGIKKAFNSSEADFSEMIELKDERNLYINKVLHSSFIEVDEKGTEAAAATSVEMKLESVSIEKEIIEFNKPFIFLIKEKKTNTILFLGQLVNPQI